MGTYLHCLHKHKHKQAYHYRSNQGFVESQFNVSA
jgi:hypothetical protein